ncbi:DUF4050 domain-containing protein [Aspergillus chevalieri]|uniref:Gag1-like clamp domain-containing protein n=1 Tax=Aspergillus chevalieri TaxID=182096 RepID=A0A7R7VP79_ASPCH|nr:uncharacterized protein ACHE_40819A [Aspergillus chevalieri]BCR88255.1 hypothetical protein ACHE_40819A [Aspergillus chevalieri]
MTSPETRDAAIREAKRYIRDIVRNDWCFEPSTSTTGPRFQTAWPISEREVKEWRPRDYEDSCSEFEPESDDGDAELERERESLGSGPEERRRRWRRAVEEEMRWNEGLRTWMERRDAWSGARTRREISEREERLRDGGAGASVAVGDRAATGVGAATDADGSVLAAKTEEALTLTGSDAQEDKPQQPTESNITESDPLPEDDHQHHEIPSPDPSSTPYSIADESYIPIVPSILSETNPIRASITPSMYPSIYSKVIVQSLTPTVPINLADVTKAMVQGWKADGQWPPKPTTTNIVLQDDATVKKKDDGEKETKKKGGVASAVRKVLHFSGFHPHHHPFHRRGSSHGNGHHHEHGGSPGPSNEGR